MASVNIRSYHAYSRQVGSEKKEDLLKASKSQKIYECTRLVFFFFFFFFSLDIVRIIFSGPWV